jgi:Mn2+/Fe2+ NRAMP family transporter
MMLPPSLSPQVGLASAGDSLATEYGSMYRIIWAVGLLASGQVSTIGLTYAGQLLMMGLLNIKVWLGQVRLSSCWCWVG